MLIALMYHRVGMGKHANSLEMLRDHLAYLKDEAPVLLPGDPLKRRSLSLCLTFDDATFDFYHYVFPLLKEFNIRVLLGVPARYILETTTLTPKERLSVPYTLAMQDGIFDTQAPFCTWQELREMVKSGLVEVASHSFAHKNLTFTSIVDLDEEIVSSKEILENKLVQPISSFIYPFGRWSWEVQEKVRKHYAYSFRIGSAANWSWGKGEKPLSRVSADNLTSPKDPLTFSNKCHYVLKALSN